MDSWKGEYTRLKSVLAKLGWRNVKIRDSDLDDWYSQGVLYSNFVKRGMAIHIEYGDDDCVFGEVSGE